MRTISQEIPDLPITKISFKITFLKVHSNLPGADELNDQTTACVDRMLRKEGSGNTTNEPNQERH